MSRRIKVNRRERKKWDWTENSVYGKALRRKSDEKDCAYVRVCTCLGYFFQSQKKSKHLCWKHMRARSHKLRSSMNKNGSQAHQKSHVRDCVSIDKNQLDKLRIMIIALGQCTQSTAVQNRINALFSFLCVFFCLNTQNTLVGYLDTIWNVL